MTKLAILDDYIGVALDYGDWSALPDEAEITVYRESIPPDRLVGELRDYEIVVITQQRAALSPSRARGAPEAEALGVQRPDEQCRRSPGPDRAGDSSLRDGRQLRRRLDSGRPRPTGLDGPRGLPAPSEMTWALIFAVAKRIGIEDRVVRAGGWQTGFPIPLAGKTLGLLGAGHLGGAMVPVAKALGMEVKAWSPNLTEERCAEIGVTGVRKEELLASADVLGVFLVFSERSRNTLALQIWPG